jgi:hypothetical protein
MNTTSGYGRRSMPPRSETWCHIRVCRSSSTACLEANEE